MSSRRLRLIDFHSHYYDATWYHASQGPGNITRAWPLLTNLEAQLAELDKAGIDTKVLSAPSATVATPGLPLTHSQIMRINDRFAALLAAYPQRLLALATIDAFQGERAAQEAQRAIQDLGLQGICIDCAQEDRFLDSPEARPTLEVAATLGVPLFVHPVSPPGLTERLARLDHTGTLLARGTETAASLLALLRSGIFDELPSLTMVLPMIGVAALLFAGIAEQEYKREDGWRGTSSPGIVRQRFYVDTMGFDPAAIHFAVDLLGAEHVLLGSDWPIMPLVPRQNIEEKLASINLTEAQQAAILSGNARRLLKRAGQEE